MSQPVWLITGCSSGFGIEIARTALSHGNRVIASSRKPSKTPELVEEIKSKGGEWISLDVSLPGPEVKQIVADAVKIYGRLDFVVNNAGFGCVGGFEDLSEHDLRTLYETNVFGVFKVLQAALPTLRAQGAGTIINISSTSGLRALPAVSLYASSKFAVEALTESLAAEYAPFGVRALLVEPGPFRTNFGGAGIARPASAFYAGTPVAELVGALAAQNGRQPGDPKKAAERIYDVAAGEGLARGKKQYLRLPLGKPAFQAAVAKADALKENFLAVQEITESADFD